MERGRREADIIARLVSSTSDITPSKIVRTN